MEINEETHTHAHREREREREREIMKKPVTFYIKKPNASPNIESFCFLRFEENFVDSEKFHPQLFREVSSILHPG